MFTSTSQYGYQLHAPSFNSSKDINLGSQNGISSPEFDAPLNSTQEIPKLLEEMCYFSTLRLNSWNFT